MAKSRWEEVKEKLPLIEKWARDGLTEEQICKNLHICCNTLNDYKKQHPDIVSALKKGREVLITEVENALIKRALGFQYEEVETAPYHLVTNKPVQQYEYITTFAGKETEEYNDQEYVWLSAFAGHGYKFVKRLTKEERKKWGYAGIWEITTVRANKEHPAMFPVELPWRCIKMHSDIGGIVLEPFSGSGTTMIACEQTERQCYAMELSPVYCDLAVKRWEEFIGQKAVKMEVVD